MEKLTDYQNRNFTAAAYITLDGVKYKSNISKQENTISFSFIEPKNLGKFVFSVSDSGVAIKAGTLNIPIDAGEEIFNLSRFAAIFKIPVAGTWKIRKESLGGVSVYVCRSDDENTVMYIDSGSKLPLKIICGGVEADIISFDL